MWILKHEGKLTRRIEELDILHREMTCSMQGVGRCCLCLVHSPWHLTPGVLDPEGAYVVGLEPGQYTDTRHDLLHHMKTRNRYSERHCLRLPNWWYSSHWSVRATQAWQQEKVYLSVSIFVWFRLEGNEEEDPTIPCVVERAPAAPTTFIYFPILPGHTIGCISKPAL